MSWTAIDDLQMLSAENIEQIYNNLSYIYKDMLGVTVPLYPTPKEMGFRGRDTPIGTILGIVKGIEENINQIQNCGYRSWINEYYVEDKTETWTKQTYDKYEKVKRWLDYMNLDYRVFIGEMPKPAYLIDINGDCITDINGNKILCYGEVYKN